MASISVKFIDFWPSFNHIDNKFTQALKSKYDVSVIAENDSASPDLLFYSRCGIGKHYKYTDCVKIFYTGENDYPNFNECDYAISFHDIDVCGRNLRYPLYALETPKIRTEANLIKGPEASHRKFCSLVMSNSSMCDPVRLKIIEAVNNYKPISSGGKYHNTIGHRVQDKIEFLTNYKFNLALENSLIDGYITEKIADAFIASTVPIYWGGKYAKSDFNPNAFINVNDYDTIDSFIKALCEIDSDPALYMSYLTAPSRLSETISNFDEKLSSFLTKIASERKIFRTDYGEMGLFKQRYSILHPLSHRRSFVKLAKIYGHIVEPVFFKR